MLNPTLVSIVALDGRDDAALLALVAGAARGLDAPLGAAFLESARERDIEMPPLDQVQEAAGARRCGGHQWKDGGRWERRTFREPRTPANTIRELA